MTAHADDLVLTTPRLRGSPLCADDSDDLAALHRDQQVLAAFGAGPLTAEETREFLERRLRHWREHGFGIWVFRDAAGSFVGRCGIHRWSLDGVDEVELGYVVRSALWSRGYATEMGHAVVSHALSALGLATLVGFTRRENVRSRRVLEKLGFVFEREFAAEGEQSVLYRGHRGVEPVPAASVDALH
ncbi:MAG TPA: GNAT family N-acetyltransferase [Gaiellaceae bacterium]|nr:GNAT family N-acetyltransferase [Gaiellaceae bacterium]